jgi:hypothetical protein
MPISKPSAQTTPRISSFTRGKFPRTALPLIHCRYEHSIFSSTTIRVRTLSTGGVHPLTTNGGTIHPSPIPGGFSLCIHGDLILVLLGLSSSVWDWKTGEEIATIVGLLLGPPSDCQVLTRNFSLDT